MLAEPPTIFRAPFDAETPIPDRAAVPPASSQMFCGEKVKLAGIRASSLRGIIKQRAPGCKRKSVFKCVPRAKVLGA